MRFIICHIVLIWDYRKIPDCDQILLQRDFSLNRPNYNNKIMIVLITPHSISLKRKNHKCKIIYIRFFI